MKNPVTVKQPQVIVLPLNKVKPYWRNPRSNSVTVEKVKKSIQVYGYNQLIGIDKKHVIVVGHARYLALHALGVKQAAFQVLDLDEKKTRAYRIADNKAGEFSTWTPDLSIELRELETELGDLRDFFTDDLDDLLAASAGISKKSVLASDLAEAAGKLSGAIDDRKKRFQEIICPKCGHEFVVSGETQKKVFVGKNAEAPGKKPKVKSKKRK